MAVALIYVVAIAPQVWLTNKCFCEFDSAMLSELTSGQVMGVNVGGGGVEKRGGFEEDNILEGNIFF